MHQIKLNQKIVSNHPLFVVIDDDGAYNYICRITIRRVFKEGEVATFDDPEEGLQFILNQKAQSFGQREFILFLDINMPRLDGFDVLDRLVSSGHDILNHLRIYMLSSSIEPRDMIRSLSYPITSGYISKPLTIELLEEFFLEKERVLADKDRSGANQSEL